MTPLSIGITCYPTFGGSGIIATELGLALAQRGHRVHFICSDVPWRLDHIVENVVFHEVQVRDYGRGIPLGKVVDVVSKINTGGKYDSKVFQKSVGLNGVGTKAVNALSNYFLVQSVREGVMKEAG